jgi:ubiquinol-cytochrome c reductase iron-sulfur subunit
VGGVGVGFVAVPFLKSWNPSAKALSAGAPVEVDISKLQPGQQLKVLWRKKPVWIVRRTEENLKDLPGLNDQLADPNSEVPQQPDYIKGVSLYQGRIPGTHRYLYPPGLFAELSPGDCADND